MLNLFQHLLDDGIVNNQIIFLSTVNYQPFLSSFDEYGTPMEIISMFGTKDKYFEAIKELETQLYNTA